MKKKHTPYNRGLILVCLLTGAVLMSGCKEKKPTPSTSAKTTSQTSAKAASKSEAAQNTVNTAAAKMEKTVAQAMEQTTCPISGKPIDKTVFAEYKGQKVYFCCKDCLAKFNAEPEKYVAKLPQFKP